MTTIPRDIYGRVHEIALRITNAVLAGDPVLEEVNYRALRDYCAEQAALGRSHPFLLETLADYTSDETSALEFYRQALDLSLRMGEPAQTILIAIGRRHLEASRFKDAEASLSDGIEEALRRGDSDAVAEAEELLREIRG
jgi:predicted urease superfamily metal-dependent hydrolase